LSGVFLLSTLEKQVTSLYSSISVRETSNVFVLPLFISFCSQSRDLVCELSKCEMSGQCACWKKLADYLPKLIVTLCLHAVSRETNSYGVVVCEWQAGWRASGDDKSSHCCREQTRGIACDQGTPQHHLQMSGEQHQTYVACREDSSAGIIP
jgi:hypothetical protein